MEFMSRGGRATGTRGPAVLCAVLVAAASVVFGTGTDAVTGAAPRTPVDGGGQPAPFVGASNSTRGGRVNSTATSLDWAGYASTGPTVTSVSGSWVQPSVTCPGTKVQQSAFWVGIDGFSSSDPTVQQIGTDADCTKKVKKVPGGPVHYAWFEMYPAGLVVLSPSNYPVNPGDTLTAGVTVTGASYALSLVDAGHWTFSTTQVAATPLPLNSSAEWIAEAPTACVGTTCKTVPLADFGSVAFSGATVNGLAVNGAGLTTHQITMTKTKKGTSAKATTSALDGTGHAFGVTWVTN